MNPMVPSGLGDFFPCKSYGHLIGWLTLVDLDLDYDVVDLGYNVIDKNKRVRERRLRQISRRIF
jgi:hypothetical protein